MKNEDARRRGTPVSLWGGVLEELLHARQNGSLPDLRTEINRLRTEARFFIEIERFILSQVGE